MAQNTIAQILTEEITQIFTNNPTNVYNHRQIASKLKLASLDAKNLIPNILEELVHLGTIKKFDKGKYALKKQVTYASGRIDMTQSGSAYVVTDDAGEDVYIAPRKLRNALHNDRVNIHVYARGSRRKLEGEVVEILTRAKIDFTGVMQVTSKFAFLVTDDRKMQHDILIPMQSLNGAKNGDKVIARITEWPEGAKNPIGEITTVLGQRGENNTEMKAILADYGFPLSFPDEVQAEADAIDKTMSAKEIKKRRDFRDILTFTIDPVDAKDFDDAISFQTLPNGNYEIGVHIADVSFYLQPGSILDQEAYSRATSVYLVDRVIPMLPEVLSNELCSLRPNEDKYTFSAVFEMDAQANVLTQWFGRTVIHSRRRFAYEDVQDILDAKGGELFTELNTINELAHKLRNERFDAGAINFESTEVKFKLDENGKPIGVYVKERKDSHKLIEEFMLLANKKVAEYVHNLGGKKNPPTMVYRTHDAPDMDNLQTFSKFAAQFGYKINTANERSIATSLNALMKDVEGKKEQNVLTHLAIRSMAKAIYTTKKSSHYGLAFDFYTHFTSPIRRYPDVMAHRLLQDYLDKKPSANPETYEPMCKHSSDMEKKAADAERASIKYKQAEYLKDNVGQAFKGIISGVTEWGMYVEIIENKCEGMIRLRDMNDDFYTIDQANYRVIGQRYKRKYQLGDEVMIEVKKVDLAKKQIDFLLLS